MTDQTYKLVPVEPASEMLEAMNRTGLINSSDCRIVYREAIAAAPEPVCEWDFFSWRGAYFTSCGVMDGELGGDFCPHCGNRVQLREEVDDD